MARKSPKLQKRLWQASKRDLLFFVNSFLLIYEPRTPAVLPFITWPYQDSYLLALVENFGRRDVLVPKSRTMGVSWMTLAAFLHRLVFYPHSSMLIISRTEDEVDKTADTDTLMWKLDFMLGHLPAWMRPPIDRSKLHIQNLANNSQIDGRSTTGNVGRGGRRLAVFQDEKAAFPLEQGYAVDAALIPVTHMNVVVSTPQGAVGSFHDNCHKADSDAVKLWLHWSEHPQCAKGLYTSVDGQLHIIDEAYEFPEDYPFILDNQLRSPWYDREVKRYPHAKLVGQELGIDFLGSAFQLMETPMVEAYRARFAKRPLVRGEMVLGDQGKPPRFLQNSNGRLLLWINPTAQGLCPREIELVVGCDVATGKGGTKSSNSTMCAYDKQTRAKIAEFKSNSIEPHEFAAYVVAFCTWAHQAFLAWEANGPGGTFSKHVLKAGYRNIYYKQNLKSKDKKASDQPGWWSTPETKYQLLVEYAMLISTSAIANPSDQALDECLEYIHDPKGRTVYHAKSLAAVDPTSTGENHGDIVIADALATMLLDERKVTLKPKDPPIQRGSYAWRQRERQARQKAAEDRRW